MISEWLNISILSIANYDLTLGAALGCFFSLIVVLAINRLFLIALGKYSKRHKFDAHLTRFIRRTFFLGCLILLIILCMLSLHLNPPIYLTDSTETRLTYRNILIAALLIVIARIADKLISSRLLEELESQTQRDIYKDQYGKKSQSNITRIVQYALGIIVATFLIRQFDLDHTFQFGENQSVSISITEVLLFFLIILVARLLLWLTVNLFLYGWYKREKIDLGKQYAYNQLLAYIVYFFAIIFAVQSMGIKLTLLLAGAAALLVGVGIALQQVISDFFSGLVILFERSVEVGDFLDFGAYRGTIKKIGLRASIVETLERKEVIIPNSHLVNDRVTNWTRTRMTTRFDVSVGTAYGSDTTLVKRLLLEAANATDGVMKNPPAFVRFMDFGASSLDFKVYFFSDKVRNIEDIKSNLRFRIDDIFREHNISIPFPQRDLWFKNQGPDLPS